MKFLRNNIKNYFSESQNILWFLLSLIIILTLIPFFKIGVTSADDLDYYLRGMLGNWFWDARIYAEGQGRFYYLITKPFYHLIYLSDNHYLTKTIQYSTLLLCFILFTIVVRKIFKQKEFAILIFLLLFSFLTVSKPMNFLPVITYPFIFTFSFAVVLLSILLLFIYMETTQYKYLIISSIVFFFALLFYETYLLFLLYICIFIFARSVSIRGIQTFTKKPFYKEIVPFISVGIIYISVYYLYRANLHNNDEFYVGTHFTSHFNVGNFFNLLLSYNLSALPTFIFHNSQDILAANSLLETGHQANLWYVLVHSKLTTIINALLQCFVLIFLCRKMDYKISWKKIGIAAAILVFLALSVHSLIGISEKHNASAWWSSLKGYVTTLYSYFFITLFIGLLFYALIKACNKTRWLKNSIMGVVAILLFVSSILIGYSNDHLSRDWEHSRNGFKVMDKVLQRGILDDIPEDAIICSSELSSSSSVMGKYIYMQSSSVWKYFIYGKTKKSLNMYDDFQSFLNKINENPQSDIYYFAKVESSKNNNVLLILFKIDAGLFDCNDHGDFFINATAHEAKVYYYSNEKTFAFSFFIPDCKDDATFYIDDFEKKALKGFNVITINNNNIKDEITSFTLKSDYPFLVNRFMVSNMFKGVY